MASRKFPRVGACVPRVELAHLGGQYLVFGFRLGSPPGNPPYSDPEGRHVPCLGVRPYLLLKAWPLTHRAHPQSCSILWRARVPSVGGWILLWWGRVYGSIVAILVLARGYPSLGRTPRVEEICGFCHLDQDTGLLGGWGVVLVHGGFVEDRAFGCFGLDS